ncbi:VOC family protein [Georgenia yuyongxinii]|uniref:VOC family protein n=1 Tax=Georgenia yuyongxinii TaxID=2589797 RepID=A0A552WMQ0_9MICO|nr:VOC family protein [Georgenia yuyongxinii]TRW43859.1 VOC family protein [Georgenia yuyongxinii]
MAIGRIHHVVYDCPDPRALARFYSALLGLPVTYDSDGWVVVSSHDKASGIAFQRAPDHQPPRWPDPRYPQQIHLDVMVDDLKTAHAQVLTLGARPLTAPGSSHVYADPAGHPFCLIRRPAWAPPVQGTERPADPPS